MLGFLTIIFGIGIGLRDGVFVSTDYYNYIAMYNTLPEEFSNALERIEPFFGLLIYIHRLIDGDGKSFLFIVSCIFSLLLSVFCYRLSPRYSILFFLLFSSTSFYYNFAFNTIRQGLAFTFLLMAMVNYHNKGKIKNSVFLSLPIFTHYSSTFPVFILLLRNYFWKQSSVFLISLLFFSLIFFAIDFTSFFVLLGEFLLDKDLISNKMIINFQYAEPVIATGRMYYFISFFICLGVIVYKGKISRFEEFNFDVFKNLFSIIYSSVLIYPIAIQFSILVRFTSFGFIFMPVLLMILMRCFFNNSLSLLLSSLAYIALGVGLIIQLNYYVI